MELDTNLGDFFYITIIKMVVWMLSRGYVCVSIVFPTT